jgi:nucleoside-triphosphatase THEP1
MGEVVLLTGERGVGKTHLCQRVVQEVRERGHSCAGVLSPPVLVGGDKVGISLVDAATGAKRALATADRSPGKVRWGKYRFVPSTLEWGARALAKATPCDLLVVDELGPLELELGQGLVDALDVLSDGDYSLALVVVRPELVEVLDHRLERLQTRVMEVTLSNRDQLPGQIVSMLD